MKLFISLVLLVFAFSSCQKTATYKELPWKPYSKEALKDSIAHNKPVMIDFWAQWCPNCHDLDRVVLSRPEIQAQLAQVTVLRVDVTNQDDPKIQQIAYAYNIEGVPTVIFLDGHGKEIENSRVIGFVTPEEFKQSLALLKIFK